MPPPLSGQELVDGLIAAAASFERDELSYLALTSGAEHVVRDRLAWALYERGFHVAREWPSPPVAPRRRSDSIDLVVLDDDGELTALEAKATYTHDTKWSVEKWNEKREQVGGETALETIIRLDAKKLLCVAGAGRAYTLLMAMHRHDRVEQERAEALGIPLVALRKLIKQSRRAPREWDEAKPQLLGYLRPLGDVSDGILLGNGCAFGVRMCVTAWLCGPLRPFEEWGPRSSGVEDGRADDP